MPRTRWLRPRNSLRGSRYESKYGPPILVAFGDSWQLSEAEKSALWRGICSAQWSEIVSWRQAIINFHPGIASAATFVATECSPATLIHILELLTHEQVLVRAMVNSIEKKLLACVNAHGRWRDTP